MANHATLTANDATFSKVDKLAFNIDPADSRMDEFAEIKKRLIPVIMNSSLVSGPIQKNSMPPSAACCSFKDSAPEALMQYKENGFHIETGVFESSFCDALIEEANCFPAARSGDFRTALQPHKHSEIFRRALRHPVISSVMSLILGAPISGLQTQFFYGRPGAPGFRPHQDRRV